MAKKNALYTAFLSATDACLVTSVARSEARRALQNSQTIENSARFEAARDADRKANNERRAAYAAYRCVSVAA